MARFLVEIEYVADRDKLHAVRDQHRDYLRALAGDGVVLAAGPLADDTGGVVIFDVEDAAHLDRLLADDPYTEGGVIERRVVREWNILLGAGLPRA